MADAHRNDDNGHPHGRQRRGAALLVLALLMAGGCSSEDLFAQGRVNEPCSAVYPTCHTQYAAGCYLDADRYTEGQLPGMRRVLVSTNQVDQIIRVRLFFREMVFPGTEILVQAYEPDCGDVSRDLRQDIDVFEEAGDDFTLIFDLEAEMPGDHLVELYSDCSADYLLTAEQMSPE